MSEETKAWHRQKRESKKGFTYYQIYEKLPLKIGTETRQLKHIISLIKGEINIENLQINSIEKQHLKKLIDSVTPVSLYQIQKFSSKWKWAEREQKHQNYNIEQLEKELLKENIEIAKEAVKGAKQTIRLVNRTSELFEQGLEHGTIHPSKIPAAARNISDSRSTDVKTSRLVTGHSTENNSNQTSLEGDITTDSKINIQDHNLTQEIILNPHYVELMREINEDKTK